MPICSCPDAKVEKQESNYNDNPRTLEYVTMSKAEWWNIKMIAFSKTSQQTHGQDKIGFCTTVTCHYFCYNKFALHNLYIWLVFYRPEIEWEDLVWGQGLLQGHWRRLAQSPQPRRTCDWTVCLAHTLFNSSDPQLIQHAKSIFRL